MRNVIVLTLVLFVVGCGPTEQQKRAAEHQKKIDEVLARLKWYDNQIAKCEKDIAMERRKADNMLEINLSLVELRKLPPEEKKKAIRDAEGISEHWVRQAMKPLNELHENRRKEVSALSELTAQSP